MGRHNTAKRVTSAALTAILFASFTMPLIASESFLRDKSRGWFWREMQELPPEPPVEEPKPEPPQVVIQGKPAEPEGPPTFSVSWFEKNYMKVFEEAVDNPTPESMDRWRMVTRVMLDKASNATQVFRERAALDVELDEQNRYPIANVMRNQMTANLMRNVDSNLNFLSDKVALWVFLDEECNFCGIQYSVVKEMAAKTGLSVSYIVKQGRPIFGMGDGEEVLPDLGHSERMGLKLTPAVVMVVPPEKFVVLSQGMLSADMLGERILLAAKNEGILDGYRYAETNPNVAGLMTSDQIRSFANLDVKSPNFDTRIRDVLRKNIEQLNAARVNRPRVAGDSRS